MKNRFGPIICLFYLLSMSCANANDSIARVGVGGITLLKSDHIRMVQEELEISTSKIRVHYKFFNESRNDIKTTIAFPMPPYRAQHPDSNDPYNRPLRAFTTFIDGQAVSTTLDRRATKGSVEITARLREIGLTDQQIFETFALCVAPGKEPEYCGLTPQQISLLQADKIEGWWVDETALWEYVFPANKAVDVVHEYSPNVGGEISCLTNQGKMLRKKMKHQAMGEREYRLSAKELMLVQLQREYEHWLKRERIRLL